MSQPDSLWKIEPLSKPSPAHAADAVEIVEGETVRRVVLPEIDYMVYMSYKANPQQHSAHELSHLVNYPTDQVAAALNRLTLAGLISAKPHSSLQ